MRTNNRGRAWFVAGFLAPATLLYAVFVVLPVCQAFQISLYRWRGISEQRTFVGLANFQRLAGDEVFRQALAHNLAFLVIGGALTLGLAMAIAHAIHGNGRWARLIRGVYLFPQIISMVVVAVLWMFVYNPSFGILKASLQTVGLGRFAMDWLGTPGTALPAVLVTFVWHAVGFHIMLFSAGLRTIPAEVQEAATLDGADGMLRFRQVTLPMLFPVLRVAIVYMVIGALNVFALVYLMTVGGPDRRTEVMLTYLYEQAFKHSDFGYGTALAVANFAVVMALSGLAMLLLRRDPTEAKA
ncbi:MAG: sugar ABC transporter permease [Armatimonadetes bacterium]|nr:sugar ABC transporter permease [Armatimonadota bacterium]